MRPSIPRKAAHRLASRARMLQRKLQPTAAPAGLPQRRVGALTELEAVNISVNIPGWLNVPASLMTLHYLDLVSFGPVVEIGVYRGKYMSIMRAAMGETCRIVGYDIFDENQAPQVEADLAAAFGSLGNIALVQVDSTTLTPARVQSDCGGAPVFMSIDGSHEADPVLSDMRLADAILDPAGIVAMDDVLNPLALGVNEGVARFLSQPAPGLVPFAYVANKLFCCRPDHQALYLDKTVAILDARGDDPSFAFYNENLKPDDTLRRRYFGHEVLIVTG